MGEAAQDVGHFILCLRPDLFLSSLNEFKSRMDHLVTVLKAQPPADGVDEILVPGEPESRAEVERTRDGIPLQQDVVDSLRAEGALIDLSFPEPIARGKN